MSIERRLRVAIRSALRTLDTPEGDITSNAQAEATGRTLAQYVTSSSAVRQWCRSNNVGRAYEAYVVQGFMKQRREDGLSDLV